VAAVVGGALDIGQQRQDFLGDQVRWLGVPLDDADPVDDRPAAVSALKAINVPSAGQGHVVGRFAIGSNEKLVGLGVGFVAVDLGRVVQQIVLIARLRRVIRERPVDEILYWTAESDVIIDTVVVIDRPQEWAITSIYASRIVLHAVEGLGPGLEACYPFAQFAVRRHRPSRPVTPTTSLIGRGAVGTNIRVIACIGQARCGLSRRIETPTDLSDVEGFRIFRHGLDAMGSKAFEPQA
jgi:hypothetical protein